MFLNIFVFLTVEGNLVEISSCWHFFPFTHYLTIINWVPPMCQEWRIKVNSTANAPPCEVHNLLGWEETRHVHEFYIKVITMGKKSRTMGEGACEPL